MMQNFLQRQNQQGGRDGAAAKAGFRGLCTDPRGPARGCVQVSLHNHFIPARDVRLERALGQGM